MEDIYEYSNRRNDIPQVKYLFVKNEFSDELKQKAWEYVRNAFGYDDVPESYVEALNVYLKNHNEWVGHVVHMELSDDGAFWRKNKPRVKAAA